MPRSIPFISRARLVAVLSACALGFALLPQGAQAAPGDSFDPAEPVVFLTKGDTNGIQLFRQTVDPTDGSADYTAIGSIVDNDMNALAYNTNDHFLYAITNKASGGIPKGALVKIDGEGNVTRVGTDTFPNTSFGTDPDNADNIVDMGGFNSDDGYLYAASAGRPTMKVINTQTGELVRDATFSQTPKAAGSGWDMAYADGYFWGLRDTTIVRIATDGQVDAFTVPGIVAKEAAGAAWTYGNGNLGFSHNQDGTITQIQVSNASSATPTFEVISQTSGKASTRNDGANNPGGPTDLAITKKAQYSDDMTKVIYTINVTNNGGGPSSGWIVRDELDSGLTGIAVDTQNQASASVVGQKVTVAGGDLAVGASISFTITATLPDPYETPVENTASVIGNEADSVASNNQASATLAVPAPAISLVKRVAEVIDVNDNGSVDAGDEIMYEFDVTNTGNVPLTNVGVNDNKADPITCPKTALDIEESTTCTAPPYVITDADAKAGSVKNTATAEAEDPSGNSVVSEESSVDVPVGGPVADPDEPVDEGAEDDLLPDTGSDTAPWQLAIAVGAVALGTMLMRRRRIAGRRIKR